MSYDQRLEKFQILTLVEVLEPYNDEEEELNCSLIKGSEYNNRRVKEYIHFRLSSLASKDNNTARPAETTNNRQIQKSQEVTAKFEDLLEEFKETVCLQRNTRMQQNVLRLL